MESEETSPDLVRVFFPKDVGRPNRFSLAKRIEYDEATPSLIAAKKVQRRPPAPTLHLHSPGFHRHRRRGTTMGGRRVELLLYMGVEMFGPIPFPHTPGRQGNELLEKEEEGS